ncbi:S8 family peptidase [Allorhizocola rhizosphaerae]|uniref:S8 family peptidase n=1 Tax=Allorhizocola rhizosphaerae TaxID=1872709 RepID=UPI0013C2A6E8|nr:S8 family serine peptidase [Allorhizocola rhizosphaerae]
MTRRPLVDVLAGALVTALLVVPGGPAVGSGGQPPPPFAGAVHKTVTLVTGDKVTFSDQGRVTVERTPDRASVGYTWLRRPDGHLLVIPSDAMELLRDGVVDQALFDVTALAQYEGMDLLITYAGREADATAKVGRGDGKVTRSIPGLRTLAVKSTSDRLWKQLVNGKRLASGVTGVWLDAKLHVTLDQSVPQIGAPAAWAAGYDGAGVTVGIIDTGVDHSHIDLWGTVLQSRTFIGGSEFGDTIGHGTHVASTIVGAGVGASPSHKGVAPQAKLLVAKVCLAANNCPTSAILDAMQWVASAGAKVVNMSLGGGPSYGIDPLEQAVNDLSQQYGTLFVVSAGNAGADASVGSPSTAASALSVGAVDRNDDLASFSSRGPTGDDHAIKPDITAPGVGIVAAASPSGPNAGSDYVAMSGTSMAAPHVTGAAAILAQRYPQWTGARIKQTLMASANHSGRISTTAQGAGRVNLATAINQTVVTDPPTFTFGNIAPGTTATRTVTYHNLGSSAITVGLQLIAHDPAGNLAPSGLFTMSTDSLTIAAGGTGSVTVTANIPVGQPEGYYSGFLFGVGGFETVVTPFGIRSDVRHTLSLRHIDRAGQQPAFYDTIVVDVNGRLHLVASNTAGVITTRLPRGVYTVANNIRNAAETETTLLRVPRLNLTADTEIVFDARTARQVRITVPDATAIPQATEVSSQWDYNGSQLALGSVALTPLVYSGLTRDDTTLGSMRVKVGAKLVKPGPDGTFTNAPAVYHLAWFDVGTWPVGYERTVPASSLATVETQYGSQVPGSIGYSEAYPQPSAPGFNVSFGFPLETSLPFTREEIYNTDAGVQWYTEFSERSGNADVVKLRSQLIPYQGGQRTTQVWNRGPFTPQLATPVVPAHWVIRWGDTIGGQVPMWGDSAGHHGFSDLQSAGDTYLTLYRDGQFIGSQSPLPSLGTWQFPVPAGHGTYRLAITTQRNAPAVLATRTTVSWTFASGHVDPTSIVRLPLWSVRMAPPVDATSTAPAGTTVTFPVTLAAQPNSSASSIRSLTIQYSTNDGVNWTSATVAPSGPGYTATVTHPAGSGFVSLRLMASDWAGNQVEQTLIRAYRIA